MIHQPTLGKEKVHFTGSTAFLEMTKVENGVQGLFEGDSSRTVEYYQ